MKKFLFLHFISLCLITNSSYSQNLFREGFIEKNNGVILNGVIEYKANQKIPDKCVFKRFDIATKVSYQANEIKAFGYKNGNRYESFTEKGKSSFYEVLVMGKINLYFNGSDYFVKKDQNGLIKIDNGPFECTENGNKKDFKDLKSFLTYLTEGKAGEISSKFNVKKDLLNLVSKYNQGSGSSYYTFNHTVSEKQLAKESSLSGANKNRIGIFAGTNIYKQITALDGALPNDMTSDYVPESGFEYGQMYGISYERRLFRKSDKLSARLELFYLSQTFYCYKEVNYSGNLFSRNDAFFDFSAVKVPVLMQYAITGSRVVPYVNAGVAYQRILSASYRHIEEKETIRNEINTTEDNYFKFKSGEFSGLAGIGLRYRLINNVNLNFQTRFEYGSGLFGNVYPADQFGSGSYVKPFKQNSLQVSLLFGVSF